MDYTAHSLLDAKDSILVTRYKETRRSHPLAATGLPLEGIALERQLLEELKGRSQLIYDTSGMKPRDLREKSWRISPRTKVKHLQ